MVDERLVFAVAPKKGEDRALRFWNLTVTAVAKHIAGLIEDIPLCLKDIVKMKYCMGWRSG
jgi:hypothetical protein